ncbi:hypothetical protein M3212_09295 [Alkalihalobacillus oceani]|uniref:hypothetical protein n=1 Tax=Halalkalibacter oceani TaxID=1653776 RepID=UPI00203C9E04|nr:hypothetical protein [Halalkalibacter oceani]MCM3760981.1 hypothetical protein [Halalkalibacter oceani]
MKQLHYQTEGELTDERLRLTYGSQLIFDGYTDDLVTSASGDLQLKLNFGTKETTRVSARKLGEQIIWIPELPLSAKDSYTTLLFSEQQFTELWTALRYDPAADLTLIPAISPDELKRTWLIAAIAEPQLSDLAALARSAKEQIIACSDELEEQQPYFTQLIEEDWSKMDTGRLQAVESDSDWKDGTAYLNDGGEWVPLKIDLAGKRYLHVGNGICVRT